MSCIFDIRAVRFSEAVHPEKQTREDFLDRNHFKKNYSNLKGDLKPEGGFFTYKQKNLKTTDGLLQHEVEPGVFILAKYRGLKIKQTRAKRGKKESPAE